MARTGISDAFRIISSDAISDFSLRNIFRNYL